MLKPGTFYKAKYQHFLYINCYDHDLKNKVISSIGKDHIFFFVKFARLRFIQVIHEEKVGYLWLPTNIAMDEQFFPVFEDQDMWEPEALQKKHQFNGRMLVSKMMISGNR